jgi:hypothetical protein
MRSIILVLSNMIDVLVLRCVGLGILGDIWIVRLGIRLGHWLEALGVSILLHGDYKLVFLAVLIQFVFNLAHYVRNLVFEKTKKVVRAETVELLLP